MDVISGFMFWKRIDDLKNKSRFETIKELAEFAGIDYTRIKNQRSDNRLPKLEDAYNLAKALATSTDYLISGEHNSTIPEKISPIIPLLIASSDEDLELIKRVLRIPSASNPKQKEA
jgi:transcriptional regulator with XRE-family HTH domain